MLLCALSWMLAVSHATSEPCADGCVVVIADGSSKLQRQTAGLVVDEFEAGCPAGTRLSIAWFGESPHDAAETAIAGPHRDLIVTPPRASLHDTMFSVLSVAPRTARQNVVVVIARDQFDSSPTPLNWLLEAAKKSNSTIYAVHLGESPDVAQSRHGFAASLRSAASRFFERGVVGQRSYSEEATLRQLRQLAESTGGRVCTAADLSEARNCGAALAEAISSRYRSTFRSSDVESPRSDRTPEK